MKNNINNFLALSGRIDNMHNKKIFALVTGFVITAFVILTCASLTPLKYLLNLSDKTTFILCWLVQCILFGGLLLLLLNNLVKQIVDIRRVMSNKTSEKISPLIFKRIIPNLAVITLLICGVILSLSYSMYYVTPLDFTLYIPSFLMHKVFNASYNSIQAAFIVLPLFVLQWFIIGGLFGLWLFNKHNRDIIISGEQTLKAA